MKTRCGWWLELAEDRANSSSYHSSLFLSICPFGTMSSVEKWGSVQCDEERELSTFLHLALEIENVCFLWCVYVAVGLVFRTGTGWLVGCCSTSFQCAGRHFMGPPWCLWCAGSSCLCASSPVGSISRCAAHIICITRVPVTPGAKGDESDAED